MKSIRNYIPIFISLLIGTAMLFIPLLGDFHIESAMLVSLAGCFWAGIRGCRKPKSGNDFYAALRIGGYLLIIGLPLLLHAVLAGCFNIDGLAFWILLPLPSVFFGYAVGRLFRSWQLSYRRIITLCLLLLIAIGIPVYELLYYPQVYLFNHVWGAWPGPIYDEAVHAGGGLLFFRILTLLWVVLLWQIPEIDKDRFSKWIVGFAVLSIAFSYANLTEFGIITPRKYLQDVLGGHKSTAHFELYYDNQNYSSHEIALLAKQQEFYYRQIARRLELPDRDPNNKIESYLYANAWQKKELVGAKFTSYVPVWLKQDQLHIAKQQLQSLKHELVHVMAKRFGNDLFHASWSIGLIEGLAVAVDGGSSATSTIDQIVVSEKPYPTEQELQYAFSARGFYGGRSGVNYITSGSFVHFLLDTFAVDSLKKAYAAGKIAKYYPGGWSELTKRWHQHLDSVQVDSVDQQTARRIFAIPSLFEQKCPHKISDFARAWDKYQFHRANYDTTGVLTALNRARTYASDVLPVKAEWSYWHLLNADYQTVQQVASLQDTAIDNQLLYADAFALSGDWNQAEEHLQKGRRLFEADPDSLMKPALETRKDREQWEIYNRITYHNQFPDSVTFATALYRTKIRSLKKAMEQEKWSSVKQYSRWLLGDPLEVRYFDEYLEAIHQLAFLEIYPLAEEFIHRLSKEALRTRYRQRLEQEREWLRFQKARSQ